MDKTKKHNIAAHAYDYFLILGTLFVVIYSLIALFYGELFPEVILKYASWVGIALAGKYLSRRIKSGLKVRLLDFSLPCLATIISIVLWFSYPINVGISIIVVVIFIVSYIFQSKKVN